MMTNKKKTYFLIDLFFLFLSFVPQNTLSQTFLDIIQSNNIVNYSTKDYLGGSHIWCIVKGEGNDLFFATNSGLSVFDGHTWQNYKKSNNTILRWLYYDNDSKKLYCALDNEFGYWVKDQFGKYNYYSLYKNENPLVSEIFWRIQSLEDNLYFQTQQKIYSYNKTTQQINEIISEHKISYLYKYQNSLFTQINDQLYKFENNQFIPTGLVINSRIIDIVSLKNKMYLLTEDQGIQKIENFKLTPQNEPINNILSKVKPFSVYQLSPNKIIVGSVLDGAFLINDKLVIEKHFDFKSGLKHTTVLSICSDSKSTIWLGLDGGIAKIIDKPSEIFLQTSNLEVGTIYDAIWFPNHLYFGTNKGLFRFDTQKNVNFIEGSQGQIWNLLKIDDHTLIICHDNGLFEFNTTDNKLQKIGDEKLWRLIPFDNNPNYFLGLNMEQYFSIYEKKHNKISFKHKIENLELGNTDAFIDRYGYIWTQDRYSKPIKIKLDKELNIESVKVYQTDNVTDTLKIAKLDGDAIFYTQTHAYIYNIALDSIIKNQHYSDMLNNMQFYPSQIEQVDRDVFFYTYNNHIAYIKRNGGKFNYYGEIFQSIAKNENKSEPYKIIPISNNSIAIGIEGGIAIFFIENEDILFREKKILEIAKIELLQKSESQLLQISEETTHIISSDGSNLHIYFKNLYPNNFIEYKIGKDGEWIGAKAFPYFEIPKLSSGKHTVYFRNVDIYNPLANFQCCIHLDVAYPWYINPIFIIALLLLIIFIGLLIRYIFKKRLQQQRKKIVEEQISLLEKEKKEFDLEILQMKLEEEERKMISLTMESIKYNSILTKMKSQTQITKDESNDANTLYRNIKNIAKSIDFHLNKEDPNKIFEKHFNTIHHGFYDRLAKKHPHLTQSEMKLCAYIKLNLSIKEIAAHINIASASVEVARYRLRKKLNLDADTNLQEYIRNI